MNKEPILFIGHGPGGANVFKPIIKLFKNKIHVISLSNFTSDIWGSEFEYIKLKKEEVINYIQSNEIKIVVTETSSKDTFMLNIVSEMKVLDVKVVSILDYYREKGNYKEWFPTLPDYIITPNKEIAISMIEEGFSKRIIQPFGSPHFERTIYFKHQWCEEFAKLLNKDKENILFISECFKEHDFSYTQEDMLIKLLKLKPKANIIVKMHPRENKEWINKYLNTNIVLYELDIDVTNFYFFTDKVYGVRSTMIYECTLLNIPTIIDDNYYISFNNPDTPRNAAVNVKYFLEDLL